MGIDAHISAGSTFIVGFFCLLSIVESLHKPAPLKEKPATGHVSSEEYGLLPLISVSYKFQLCTGCWSYYFLGWVGSCCRHRSQHA